MLAYGCILYTGYGMCTEDEVSKDGKYNGAIVLPKNRYCLKDKEYLSPAEEMTKDRPRCKHFTVNVNTKRSSNEKPKPQDPKDKDALALKQRLITSEDIISDIIEREKKQKNTSDGNYINDALYSNTDNSKTFAIAYELIHEQFDSIKIAGEMVKCFESLFL